MPSTGKPDGQKRAAPGCSTYSLLLSGDLVGPPHGFICSFPADHYRCVPLSSHLYCNPPHGPKGPHVMAPQATPLVCLRQSSAPLRMPESAPDVGRSSQAHAAPNVAPATPDVAHSCAKHRTHIGRRFMSKQFAPAQPQSQPPIPTAAAPPARAPGPFARQEQDEASSSWSSPFGRRTFASDAQAALLAREIEQSPPRDGGLRLRSSQESEGGREHLEPVKLNDESNNLGSGFVEYVGMMIEATAGEVGQGVKLGGLVRIPLLRLLSIKGGI